MSVPFLKVNNSGVCLKLSKALYGQQAVEMLQKKAEGRVQVKDKGRYYHIQIEKGSEEDGLAACEQLLLLAKTTRH